MPGEDTGNPRLSQIPTLWSVLRRAHEGPADEASGARQQLLERYHRAIHRYLLAAVGNLHDADDLAQQFAVCLLNGDFRHADPRYGRFRNYVKGVLFHLVRKHARWRQKQPAALAEAQLTCLAAPAEDPDRQFIDTWRGEILARTWQALAAAHPDFHAVLRLRGEQPTATSQRLAEQLSQRLGRPFTASGFRQAHRRGKALFWTLLRQEIAQSLEAPTSELIDDELRELDLLGYFSPPDEE